MSKIGHGQNNHDLTVMIILNQLRERNLRECVPFEEIHKSNTALSNQVDTLQAKCEKLENEILAQNNLIDELSGNSQAKGGGYTTNSATLKAEARLREKLEHLQQELNDNRKQHAKDQDKALQTANELARLKDFVAQQEATIRKLNDDEHKLQRALEHLNTEFSDAKSRTKLAEQQYRGLKDTIRLLQEENDKLKKENRKLEARLVTDKDALSTEVNTLSDMVEKLKKENDMLRTLKAQEEKRKPWFGLVGSVVESVSGTVTGGGNGDGQSNSTNIASASPQKDQQKSNSNEDPNDTSTRKWGTTGVVLPSEPRHSIQAHNGEASCVRYDFLGSGLVCTGGSDGTVKVWDSSNGTLQTTLRGGNANTIIGCDIANGLVIGAGSDKTCRVWNLRTDRMVHHLVGHAHKITCVKLFGNEKAVLTGSADRSLKLWDISRKTYRQTTTLRHSSTSNCSDVAPDAFTVVSGHLDGGIRLWDLRNGERTADLSNTHEGAITSVHFSPANTSQILTTGMDSCIKIVDIRTCLPLQTFRHDEFQVSYGWMSSSFSPDGTYVASGSSNGQVFVWCALDGGLKKKLLGHDAGLCGTAWNNGGASGQQFCSVDRNGKLVLWA